jgi:hypothetical protein
VNSPREDGCKPLETDAEILIRVVYASPAEWGTTREEVLLGHLIVSLFKDHPNHMYLLAWPDGVRAMLPSTEPPGSPQMNLAVVKTYRAAASGYVGPAVVGEAR